MMYVAFLLSVMFVIGFVGVSSKPSPVYGGLGLVISGGVGCGIVLSFGGSFLGLMMFLIYLGGMLVVFGYTTAMATEEYPETWGSNIMILSMFISGVLLEVGLIMLAVMSDDVDFMLNLKSMGDWVVFEADEVSLIREDSMGVAALYSCGSWLMVIAGWSLFVSIFIIIEITRGG
uniref:NADH dehydrogenase subunit 6 n=1 Tax=Romerolagus diazi TaxID=48089 RepID=UPI0021CC5F5E|nr:NADH dehydrogenase subunit 6 [Romerolagus diazi]UWJ89990.1 NADH dehydrogenase subunit 6 [Romerolagus diazi]